MNEEHGFLDTQLRMLRENHEGFRSLSLNLNRMEKDFSQQLAHWRESLFSFQVAQWLEVIRSNTTVDTVAVDLSVSANSIWKSEQLKALMAVIGSLPKLRKLVLRQNSLGEPRRIRPFDGINAAIQEARLSLDSLELWGSEIVPGHEKPMQALLWAIEGCQKLRSLKLFGFRLSHEHVISLAPLLVLPHLTEFWLGNTSDGFLPIAKALQMTTSIKKLTLCFTDQLDDTNCLALAKMLQNNTTLQYFGLLNVSPSNKSSGLSSKCVTALIHMLQYNLTLQELTTRGDPVDEIQLYVKLNRAGRQHLVHPMATRDLWVNTLISSRDDLDCSYCFLTMNPSICFT